MTQERIDRIKQAMSETQAIVDRAMQYSPKFRDHAMIGTYQQHLAKLQSLLDGESLR